MDDLHKLVAQLHANVRAQVRESACHAHARGAGRDDHEMNPGSPAVVDWQAEWDRCEVTRLKELQRVAA